MPHFATCPTPLPFPPPSAPRVEDGPTASRSDTPPTPSTSSRPTSPTPPRSPRSRSTTTASSTASCPGCSFNQRVLELAEDPSLPLLERVPLPGDLRQQPRRVLHGPGGRPQAAHRGRRRRTGGERAAPPRAARAGVAGQPRADAAPRAASSTRRSSPSCATQGIEIVRWSELDREEQKICKKLFKDRIFPVLTPLAVDPAHPFPYISGLSLNLAVVVRNPKSGTEHFARVKVPPIFSRFVPVGNQRFVPLEDVIGEHLKKLFPGMEVLQAHTFRVTRNEDLEVEEDDAENLLKALEKELLRRRFGPPVRLEVEESIDRGVLDLLVSELGVTREEVTRLQGPLDLRGLHSIADLPPRGPQVPRVPADHPPPARGGRDRQAGRRVRGRTPPGRAAAPPLRLVRHVGAALPRAGRGRPARARDQADALPHLRRQPDHRRPRRRRRGRQAGAGDRRDQGPLRRVRPTSAGPASSSTPAATSSTASSASRPTASCRWWCATSRTASAATPTSAPATTTPRPRGSTRTSGCSPPTRPIGEDVAHLFNNLSGISRNTTYDGLLVAPDSVRDGLIEPDPRRGRQPPGGPRVRDPDQGQLDRRRGDHRRALPRLPGRRPRRAAHPRHLRPAPRRARPLRDHQGALGARPVPRAQPGLLVRQRRRARWRGSARPT